MYKIAGAQGYTVRELLNKEKKDERSLPTVRPCRYGRGQAGVATKVEQKTKN